MFMYIYTLIYIYIYIHVYSKMTKSAYTCVDSCLPCSQVPCSVREPADERAGGRLQRLDQLGVSVSPPPVCAGSAMPTGPFLCPRTSWRACRRASSTAWPAWSKCLSALRLHCAVVHIFSFRPVRNYPGDFEADRKYLAAAAKARSNRLYLSFQCATRRRDGWKMRQSAYTCVNSFVRHTGNLSCSTTSWRACRWASSTAWPAWCKCLPAPYVYIYLYIYTHVFICV